MNEHVVVRPADLKADALSIYDGALAFISQMEFDAFLPDEGLAYEIGRVLTLPGMEVLVAEHEGEIVGGIGLLFAPFLWNSTRLSMEELFWWAAPDAPTTTALRLLRATEKRREQVGATIVTFKALTSSPKSIGRLYARMGLQPVDTSYMKVV